MKSGTHWRDVTRLGIWGNHSSTHYPDFFNAHIGGTPAAEVIADRTWLEGDFVELVQQRGAAIIQARGLSSAKSAAHGVIGTVRSLSEPTPEGDWHSVALCADGSYGVEQGLISSFPIRSDGRKIEIIQDLSLNAFSKSKSKPLSPNLKKKEPLWTN